MRVRTWRNIQRLIGIITSWAIAGVIFWLCFFVAASYISSLISVSAAYKGLVDFLIAIVIAWCGGIFVPLFVGIAGTVITISITD